ncbi:hypothetical protein HS141_15625 [Cetobacterium somerae]|uniref:hypothetical protein n=1 Tax=Cetobacterium somerae TaxID=188913 RepID=UPI00211EC6BF|nr:hypothetical protein [Cetobacterium somerae]MCQ9628348.1 hypothetical protein [Cetobacterium somerae]
MERIFILKQTTNNKIQLSENKEFWNNLKNNNSSIVYKIYCNYLKNSNETFDIIFGIDILNSKEIFLTIPRLTYQIFVSNTKNISKSWEKIQQLENNKIIKRSYIFDYEKYYPNGEVHIFLGIK